MLAPGSAFLLIPRMPVAGFRELLGGVVARPSNKIRMLASEDVGSQVMGRAIGFHVENEVLSCGAGHIDESPT
jgi:hypothetical protein